MVRERKKIKTLSLLLLVAMVLPDFAYAADKALGVAIAEELSTKLNASVSEYYFRNDRDDLLMPVYVLGSVGKPGLYHIPIHADLVTLLTISGGASTTADLSDIKIKNQDTKTVTTVDLEADIANKNAKAISLRGNDVILVAEKKPLYGPGFLTTLTVVGTVAAIILSYYLVKASVKNNY